MSQRFERPLFFFGLPRTVTEVFWGRMNPPSPLCVCGVPSCSLATCSVLSMIQRMLDRYRKVSNHQREVVRRFMSIHSLVVGSPWPVSGCRHNYMSSKDGLRLDESLGWVVELGIKLIWRDRFWGTHRVPCVCLADYSGVFRRESDWGSATWRDERKPPSGSAH